MKSGLLLLALAAPAHGAGLFGVLTDGPADATPRTDFAKALDRARELGAAGVVLFDVIGPSQDAVGEAMLAEAMTRVPTLLGARITMPEVKPQPLLERFGLFLSTESLVGPIRGWQGWFPAPRLQKAARGLGFTDLRTETAVDEPPLLGRYNDVILPSLWLKTLELAYGAEAEVVDGPAVRLGTATVALARSGEALIALPEDDAPQLAAFDAFLRGDVPAERVAGRIVVIANGGYRVRTYMTPHGPAPAPKVFLRQMQALFEVFRQDAGVDEEGPVVVPSLPPSEDELDAQAEAEPEPAPEPEVAASSAPAKAACPSYVPPEDCP